MNTQNFTFLSSSFPDLAECGTKAEEHVWTDPTASVMRSRMFLEITLKSVSEHEGVMDDPTLSLSQRLGTELKSYFPPLLLDSVHRVRIEGNKAVHCEPQSTKIAMEVLKNIFEIGKWLHSKYISPVNQKFVGPANPADQYQNDDKELREKDALIRSLSDKLLEKEKELRESPRVSSPPRKGASPFTALFEIDGFEFGKNVVKDTRTGLFWARNGNLPDFPPYGHLHDWGSSTKIGFDWLEAQKWAEELNLDGHYDWRLPTNAEIMQLCAYAREKGFGSFPRITNDQAHRTCSIASYFCSIGFKGVISNIAKGTYWTSDIDANGVIWEANLSTGKLDNFTNARNSFLVWPVRDGGVAVSDGFKKHWHIIEDYFERLGR
ncbi:DUF1566 domain-containing protein [Geomonas sp. Red32]|uniref:Lcl C-terminal domain-containing protein n=1 Tax=Geomonas sp. Red32 TaxID=2912856 RepID=UPI00202CBC18|nr:DUF1566 domain-containing protein [Geomonas sp. Red32]MCM0083932.1 DUF1566 domain-containing protein [Geomonas sp. Red32]